MIFALVVVVHILVALFLIGVILLQGGRGGMGEALSGATAQSLFGGSANTVMTKVTAVGAALFMVTCLSLAALSTAKGRSVIDQLPMTSDQLPFALPPAEPVTSESRDRAEVSTPEPVADAPAPLPAPTTQDASTSPSVDAPFPPTTP